MVGRPSVLFLDEATTGLDPAGRAGVWELLRDRVAEGMTVLLTTQYLEEADRLAARIAVIDHGRAIANGSPAELKARVGGQTLDVRVHMGAASSASGLASDGFARVRTIVAEASGSEPVLGDAVRNLLSLVLVFAIGAALGFRPHGSALRWLAGCALILLFAFAVCWIAVLIGVLARTPESIQGLSLLLIFPFAFGSNVFVPTGKLPGWLQAWVAQLPGPARPRCGRISVVHKVCPLGRPFRPYRDGTRLAMSLVDRPLMRGGRSSPGRAG